MVRRDWPVTQSCHIVKWYSLSFLSWRAKKFNKNPFFITGDKNINVHGIFYPHDDVDIDGLIRGEKKLNYEDIKTIYR